MVYWVSALGTEFPILLSVILPPFSFWGFFTVFFPPAFPLFLPETPVFAPVFDFFPRKFVSHTRH